MMARKTRGKIKNGGVLAKVWGFLSWIVGVLVALAVGFGMIYGNLSVPNIPYFVTGFAGWFVVVLTVFGSVIAIIDMLRR